MKQKTYRHLLIFFSLLILIFSPTFFLPLTTGKTEWNIIIILGIMGWISLPIAVMGLWTDRLWGLITIIIGTLFVGLPALKNTGKITVAIGIGFFHIIVLLLALNRFISENKKRKARAQQIELTKR